MCVARRSEWLPDARVATCMTSKQAGWVAQAGRERQIRIRWTARERSKSHRRRRNFVHFFTSNPFHARAEFS
eukprot:scaffold1253_cov245-Pinguiococcus_pyrenoidosus.AAC.1